MRQRALPILCLALAAALALTAFSAPGRTRVATGVPLVSRCSSATPACRSAAARPARRSRRTGTSRTRGGAAHRHRLASARVLPDEGQPGGARAVDRGEYGAIVVAPHDHLNPLAAGGCWINGAPMARAVADLFAADRSALQTSANAARGGRVWLPHRFVLSGNSAGGNLATGAAGDTALPGGDIADLRGVVLFDAVDYGTSMQNALARLTGVDERSVLQIASPPNPCNAFGSGTAALLSARPDRFVGVELVDGTHLDAEGPNIGPLAEAVCGHPQTVNVDAVRVLAADWITNALTGSSLGIVGGSPGAAIPVGGATAMVLPAAEAAS